MESDGHDATSSAPAPDERGGPAPRGSRSLRRWNRLALLATLLLVLLTLGTLPATVTSMRAVLGRAPNPVYDLLTGQPVSGAEVAAASEDAIYINFGLVQLDEGSGLITIAVSGNRNCGDICPALTLTLTALDDAVEQRRGLPPSASLRLTPDDRVFSEAVELPVRGQPNLYPFDEYILWLGVVATVTDADGTRREIVPALVAASGTVTLQNRISDLVMAPPAPVDPGATAAATDAISFLATQAVRLERPAYIQRMSVTLIVLIAISAALAVFTRGFSELLLGIGGLILGAWGVRSVLMPRPVPAVTMVDVALSWVIFLLLFGLALRALMHFYRGSDLPMPAWVRFRDGD